MTTSSAPTATDPRILKTRAAVMKAATDLLVEGGPDALTVDAVVARSGVAKTTVYRHWETRDQLVLAVITDCAPLLDDADPEASFTEALRHIATQMVEIMGEPHWRRLAPAMILLKAEQREMANLDDAMKAQQTRVISEILERGVAEGAVRPDVLDDIDLALTLLAGPIIMAGLVDSVPLDDNLAHRAVDQFLAGHRP